MPKATKQSVTRLAGQPCVNPVCNRKITPRGTNHLCFGCETHWRRFVVPVSGFISSSDLKHVTTTLLREIDPSPSGVTQALRLMRGTRHWEGDWSERPAYRLQPLLHGRWNQRLPHLLVGRRTVPTMKLIVNAVAHFHLANTIIGTRSQYSYYLAGCTFYGRRGPMAPAGADVSKGNAKSAGYRLSVVDFSAIGQRCLKAGAYLGLHLDDRSITDRIVSIYAAGLEAGVCHKQLVVPSGTFQTRATGDHPLDHLFSKASPVPRQYIWATRRASGLIKGAWPEGLDLSWEEREHIRRQPKPNPYLTKTNDSTPDVSWIFIQ